MGWRVARSLDVLLHQFNSACPRRSKASDGSIGNAEHASRSSDHNPWYGPGIVTARDFTHDPANGMDINKISDQLAASRDPRIKYIIANAMILDSRPGNNPWRWVPYHGSNAHRKHFHLSVMNNALCDASNPWILPMLKGVAAPPIPNRPAVNSLQKGSKGDRVKALQSKLNRMFPSYSKLVVDGVFGPGTDKVVREFQRRSHITSDGIAGPRTLQLLGLA